MAAASAALLGAALCGCSGETGASGGEAGVPGASSTLPAAKGGPLTDLPGCSAPPEATDEEETAGIVLPEEAVVTGVEDLGDLVSVRGYVPLTPIQVRRFYVAAPGLRLYAAEDEVYEAEILFGSDDRRVFVKAQAQCQQGSMLSIFVGPEDGEGLPPLTGS